MGRAATSAWLANVGSVNRRIKAWCTLFSEEWWPCVYCVPCGYMIISSHNPRFDCCSLRMMLYNCIRVVYFFTTNRNDCAAIRFSKPKLAPDRVLSPSAPWSLRDPIPKNTILKNPWWRHDCWCIKAETILHKLLARRLSSSASRSIVVRTSKFAHCLMK